MELRELGAPIGVSVLCPGVVPTRIAESERNRPGGPRRRRSWTSPTQHELPPTALRPEQIADLVIAAIRDDTFWIVTHEGSAELIEQRCLAMTGGGRPEIPPVF